MGKDLCLLPCSSTAASALILQGRSSSGKPMRCSQTSSLGWGCLQPPGEMNHKQGTKLSRALRKFQVCRREVKSGRCPRLSVRVGNRWQRGQKKIPAKTRRAWGGGVSCIAPGSGCGGVSPSGFSGQIQWDGTESRGLARDVASTGAAASRAFALARPHVVITTARCRRARGAASHGIAGARRGSGLLVACGSREGRSLPRVSTGKLKIK